MALMPVCSGSQTGWRCDTPVAITSTGRNSLGVDRALAVQRIAQRVEHAAHHRFAHRDGQQPSQGPHFVALVDAQVVAENDHADAVLFQVEGQPLDAVGEFDHFAGHHAGQAVHAGDSVADFEHRAHFADIDLALELLDFFLQD